MALVEVICEQSGQLDYSTLVQQKTSKSEVIKEKREAQSTEVARLRPLLSQAHQRLLHLASEKGSSSWLAALPIESHGLSLHKGAFRDALSLRYGWQPQNLPTK